MECARYRGYRTHDELLRVSEELLADGVALRAGKVGIEPRRELIVAMALLLSQLVVPALHEAPADRLHPLLHLM